MISRAQNVRSNYPTAYYEVNGRVVSAEQLKLRTMNFGQHWRGEGVQNLPYLIRLPIKLGIDILEWQLPEYIEDSKAYPDEQDLMEQLLRQNNWPVDGTWLLKEGPELLRQMLLEYYPHEMLMQWLGDGDIKGEGYVLNTCDSIHIEGDYIHMTGQCRSTGTSQAYQDV